MGKNIMIATIALALIFSGCATTYVAKPLPFKMPEAYNNAQTIGGAVIGARAFVDSKEASDNFGFNIREAGMLPVEIVIDNKGPHPLEINASQTFLVDKDDNLWPVLAKNFAYDRATRYAQTNETFKAGAYQGFLGSVAGAAIGAAIGVLTGDNIVRSAGKGAVVGAAAAGVSGGVNAYNDNDARHAIIDDLQSKSMQTRPIMPGGLSYGFVFFPGEAKSAKQVRLQIVEKDTGRIFPITMTF